jgi:hypothetical protein
MPMENPWPDSPYALLVARREKAPLCRVFAAYSSKRLHSLPVPLAPPDPDVALDLQPLIDTIYERWHYERDIDYTQALNPSLAAEEMALLKQSLAH